MSTLEVLLCTFNQGIQRVKACILPPHENVSYLVSCQLTDNKYRNEVPAELLSRQDVRIIFIEGKGLAANRNNALDNAQGDVLLLADDDVRYKAEYFDKIISTFDEYPKVDIGCFEAIDEERKPLREYPDSSLPYNKRPYGFYSCSCEIAFRRTPHIPRFDERFGLGAEYLCGGEEDVFLYEAQKRGQHIRFFPYIIVQTPGSTTGKRYANDARVRASVGAAIYIIHGPVGALLRYLKYSFERSYEIPFFVHFNSLFSGMRYILTHPRR